MQLENKVISYVQQVVQALTLLFKWLTLKLFELICIFAIIIIIG
jgi:hypothetical protein